MMQPMPQVLPAALHPPPQMQPQQQPMQPVVQRGWQSPNVDADAVPYASIQTPREVPAQPIWQAPSLSSPSASVGMPRARHMAVRNGGAAMPSVPDTQQDGEGVQLAGAPMEQE